jgi:SsrA-binding protein
VKSVEVRPIARNRKARHQYEILEIFEAGLVLAGTEVKSLRGGKASMGEAYVRVRGGEAWLENCHIPPYDHASHENHDPRAARKLLLSKRQIRTLQASIMQKGLTIVPLRLYFRGAWVKVEIAVARGKKLHDKRQSLKKLQAKRDIDRARRGG